MSTMSTTTVAEPSTTQDALSRVLDEAQSLEADALLTPNVDIESAILTVLGAASRTRPYLAALRELPGLRVKGIEALQDYAMALAAASVRVRTACAPRSELPGLLARASQWRRILISEAETLSLRGLIAPGAFGRVRSRLQRARGYKNVAFDLMALAQFFADAWPAIAARTGLTAAEVHDAFALGLELMEAAPKSQNTPDPRTAAVELRARVFTLLHRAYAELRQGMKYLRWREGDADRIVPSLYQRGPTPRRTARPISSSRDASTDTGTTRARTATANTATANTLPAAIVGGDPKNDVRPNDSNGLDPRPTLGSPIQHSV